MAVALALRGAHTKQGGERQKLRLRLEGAGSSGGRRVARRVRGHRLRRRQGGAKVNAVPPCAALARALRPHHLFAGPCLQRRRSSLAHGRADRLPGPLRAHHLAGTRLQRRPCGTSPPAGAGLAPRRRALEAQRSGRRLAMVARILLPPRGRLGRGKPLTNIRRALRRRMRRGSCGPAGLGAASRRPPRTARRLRGEHGNGSKPGNAREARQTSAADAG